MPVRFGIIGVGRWPREVHIPNLLVTDGAEVTALCSRSEENRAAGAALCSERPLLFERLQDMLACDRVDAVVICTPNALHAAQALEALRAGKHVLCEKPLALTRAHAQRVAQAVARSGRVLAVGFELRCSDVVRAAIEAIDAGRIGRPLLVTGRVWRAWGGALTGGWREDVRLSGGLIPEIYSHLADLQACLVGEVPATVVARAGALKGPPLWERLSVICEYPGGALSAGDLCLLAYGAGAEFPFEIVGEQGRLAGDVVKGQLTLWTGRKREPTDLSPVRGPVPIRGFPGTRELMREFVDCVLGRRDRLRAGLEVGLAAVEICVAIGESVKTGRAATVQWDAAEGRRTPGRRGR